MSSPVSPHNILVVEDEWLIALDIGMLIEEQGHQVVGPAQSVARALELIEEVPIDAALLDVTLGPEKSFPVAEKLDELDVPLSFLTAYAKTDIPSDFRKYDLLPKPLTVFTLRKQLQKMLGQGQ